MCVCVYLSDGTGRDKTRQGADLFVLRLLRNPTAAESRFYPHIEFYFGAFGPGIFSLPHDGLS